MADCCRLGAARKYELFQRFKLAVESIQNLFKIFHSLRAEHFMPWNRELSPQIKQVVLYLSQGLTDLFRDTRRQQQPRNAVEFVNVPVGFNPRIILVDLRTFSQASLSFVA